MVEGIGRHPPRIPNPQQLRLVVGLRTVDHEINGIAVVLVPHMQRVLVYHHTNAHLFRKLARKRRFIGFAFFDSTAWKLPQERHTRVLAALGDEITAVTLNLRSDDANVGSIHMGLLEHRRHTRCRDHVPPPLRIGVQQNRPLFLPPPTAGTPFDLLPSPPLRRGARVLPLPRPPRIHPAQTDHSRISHRDAPTDRAPHKHRRSLPMHPRLWPLLLFLVCAACAHRRPVETGKASWYGPGFRGKPTASGERFVPWKRTAAHKTLPFGTVVRVTRLDTGKKVRVVINDRGPYAAGRVIDLSKKAARRIDLIDDGVTMVEVKVVGCRSRRGPCGNP